MATPSNDGDGDGDGDGTVNSPRDSAGQVTEYQRGPGTLDPVSLIGFRVELDELDLPHDHTPEQRWPVDPSSAPARHVPPRGPQPTFSSQDDVKHGFYLPTPEAEFADSVSHEDTATITALIGRINEAKAQANVSLARWDELPEGPGRQRVEHILTALHRQIIAGKEGLDALVAKQGPAAAAPTRKAAPDPRAVHTSQRDLADSERQVMRQQIGNPNVLAISGGRIFALRDGIELPVSKGYSVRVHLDLASDTYTVERIFSHRVNGVRNEWAEGRKHGVSGDDLGEQAFRASCYVSYDQDEW